MNNLRLIELKDGRRYLRFDVRFNARRKRGMYGIAETIDAQKLAAMFGEQMATRYAA